MRRRVPAHLSLLAALTGSLLLSAPEATAPAPADPRFGLILARIDSLSHSENADAALGLASSALRDARALADRATTARLLSARAPLLVFAGRPASAEASAREAVGLARVARDSALEMRALRWLAVAVEQQGRLPEAMTFYQRSLALAIRLRDAEHEGWGRVALGYSAYSSGRLDDARAQYQRALAIFRATRNRLGENWALNGLGLVHQAAGDIEPARECYQLILSGARAAGNPTSVADALNNLGTIQFSCGAPEAAVAYFREADLVYRSVGNVHGHANTARSIAICMVHLGQFADAASLLDSTLALCRERALKSDEAFLLEELATVRRLERRLPEAAELYNQAIRILRPSGDPRYLQAVIGRAQVSIKMDSAGPALAWLDRELSTPGSPIPAELLVGVGWCRGELLFRLGHLEESLDALLRADDQAEALGVVRGRMAPLVRAAQIERRLGRWERASAVLARAASLWENERGLSRDPRWREETAESARWLYAEIADQMLSHPGSNPPGPRARMAFDALQRFKARTLHERMMGPSREATASAGKVAAVTVHDLQARVLGEGEVLIDTFLGPDVTFLFAVTRDSCRAVRLGFGDSLLAPRLRLYHDLLATQPPRANAERDQRALAASRRALSDLLFGRVTDMTGAARRIVLAPDGWLNIVPAGAFDLQGVKGTTRRRPGAPAEVVQVPSATILAELRAHPTAPGVASARPAMLAVAGAPRPGERSLAGARSEVDWLAHRYAAEIWATDRGGRASIRASDLARYRVLHLAAHTWVDDQHPWRSGILLRPASHPGDDSCLTAAEVARLRLRAPLVVLSGCESARGRLISGEGVLGLTGAFIAAGSPAVIASLWPVSDRATTRLMQAFYRSLERGRPVAAALREAQAGVASDPRTAHPFYWAGFVIVGDGDLRVALRRSGQSLWMPRAEWAAIAAAAGLLALIRSRRAGTRGPSR